MRQTEEQPSHTVLNGLHLRYGDNREEPSTRLDEEGIDWNSVTTMEEWKVACRIAANKRLFKSELLPRFLLYVCEETLRGNAGRISEQRIGIRIFNRPAGYNPGEDNIVRSYARTLRKRLDEYFESEGKNEAIRIAIPRGGYVPVFEANTTAPPFDSESSSVLETEGADARNSTVQMEDRKAVADENIRAASAAPVRSSWLMALIGLLAGFALASCLWRVISVRQEKTRQDLSHPIWAELFQQNRDTLIVPADSGLGILQNLTGHLITLETYANGSYFSDEKSSPSIGADNIADLRGQRYTSVACLNIAARLMQLSETSTGRTEIRYARSISVEDLKSSNIILLGSSHTNPWVTLFEDHLNFKLKYLPTVNQSFVLNERPQSGEQKQYLNGTGQMTNRTYGVIDYVANLDGNGHVLIIQGLNMAGTQAAADALFHSAEMKSILSKATLPNGTLRSFELLIQTSSIGATDPGAQIIATRFYP